MKRPSHTLVVYASNLLIATKGSIPRTAVSSVKFLNIKGPSLLSLESAFHLCTFHSLKRGGESDGSQSCGPPAAFSLRACGLAQYVQQLPHLQNFPSSAVA